MTDTRRGRGPGHRGAPRPRGNCPVCGREVSTTETRINAVWHNRPGSTFPNCPGTGRPVHLIARQPEAYNTGWPT